MKGFFDKIIIQKQKRCIKAIELLNKPDNIYIYNTGKNFIKYHEPFLDVHLLRSPLKNIRKHYIKDLKYRRFCLKRAKGDYLQQLTNIINADIIVLDELTDEFINKYEELSMYVDYINNNKRFLTPEQEQEYLIEFYKLTNNNLEYDKLKVRSVK